MVSQGSSWAWLQGCWMWLQCGYVHSCLMSGWYAWGSCALCHAWCPCRVLLILMVQRHGQFLVAFVVPLWVGQRWGNQTGWDGQILASRQSKLPTDSVSYFLVWCVWCHTFQEVSVLKCKEPRWFSYTTTPHVDASKFFDEAYDTWMRANSLNIKKSVEKFARIHEFWSDSPN